MAIFSVTKSDLEKCPGLEEEAGDLCESVSDAGDYVVFIPRDGELVALGVMLTEKGVSYQLDFEENSCD